MLLFPTLSHPSAAPHSTNMHILWIQRKVTWQQKHLPSSSMEPQNLHVHIRAHAHTCKYTHCTFWVLILLPWYPRCLSKRLEIQRNVFMRPHIRALGDSASYIGYTETHRKMAFSGSEQKKQWVVQKSPKIRGNHLCRLDQRSKNKWKDITNGIFPECHGPKRKTSRASPALNPVVAHSLCFGKFLFLKINLKARLPERNYKALGSSGIW